MLLPHLILSAVSMAESPDDFDRIRAIIPRLADRASKHGPTGLGNDALNCAIFATDAAFHRLAGDIKSAVNYERAMDRILTRWGY